MTKLIKRLVIDACGLLVLLVLIGPAQSVAASTKAPDKVDIVLHKLLFDDHLPTAEANNGKDQPSFGGQPSRPLNGVTFTAYDITSEFWQYEKAHDGGVEKAQRHFAEAAYVPTNKVASQVTAGAGEARFADLSLRSGGHYAVYLFKETGTPPGVQGQSQNLVVVLPVRDDSGIQSRIDLFPKNVLPGGKPMIEKRIDANQTTFDYGQKIPFKITVAVPADVATMKAFRVTDKADPALRLTDGVSVMIDGHDLTGEDNVYQLAKDAEDAFTLTFNVDQLSKYANKVITITYNMAIRPGTAADKPLVNQSVVYPGGGEPQHDFATVVTGGKRFVKVDAKDHATKLAGATFVVRDALGLYLVKTATGWDWKSVTDGDKSYQEQGLYALTSDQDGAFSIDGLAAGNYELYEVKAPEGYLRNEKVIPFQIVAGEASDSKAAPYAVVNVPDTDRPHLPDTPGDPPKRPHLPETPGDPDRPRLPGTSGEPPARPHLPGTNPEGAVQRILRRLLPQTGEAKATWLTTLGLILIGLIATIGVKTNKKSIGESRGERQ